MATRTFTAIYRKQGAWVVAWVEEVPGANTQGRTKREARENLKEALKLVLEAQRQFTVGRGPRLEREALRVVA